METVNPARAIHPPSITTYPTQGLEGGWSLSQLTLIINFKIDH